VWGSNPGRKSFSLPKCPDRLWGATQPPAQWVPSSFPEVTRQMREDDHHPLPHNAKVKYEWSFSHAPPYAFMALTGITLPLFLSKCKRSTLLPSQEQTPPRQAKKLHSSEMLVPTYQTTRCRNPLVVVKATNTTFRLSNAEAKNPQ